MEFLDIYDEKGNSLGYSKTRDEAHKNGLWHKIACIFIVNSKNEVIMQKRSSSKVSNPNGWVCSASGHIDAGENVITGALRELYEEIGIKAEEKDLKHIGTIFETHKFEDIDSKHISELFVIYKDVDINKLILDPNEVSDAKYFKIEEIEKNSFATRHNGLFETLKKELKKDR